MQRYMSAREAADTLGVSIATIYAYVSRGLIRSEAAGGSTRRRRYYREDVERLKQRRNPEKVVETALNWGAPLLDSQLTLIAEGCLYYRGRDALALAQQHSIEAVAALLWAGELDAAAVAWPDTLPALALTESDNLPGLLDDATLFERMQALLPLAALRDPAAYDLRPASVILTGARILYFLAAVAAGQPVGRDGVAASLQRAWRPNEAAAVRLIDMALILCADHELNVSSFTARCVASAGSTPYAAVTAGLAALQGTQHGGMTEKVSRLLREINDAGQVRPVLVNWLKQGDALPGFGHRLYAEGDPRARLLLETTAAQYPQAETVVQADAICRQVLELTGERPTIDFGLAVLAAVLRLPVGAPLALFALGRTVGWIGHALEQYAAGQLIRPRARYVGALPQI